MPRAAACGEPLRRRVELAVAVPLSYAETEHGLMLRTLKWGLLARLAAVFRVDRIILYETSLEPIDKESRELALTVLRYLVVAPYLRKRVFPLTRLLRYAGVLPPLQLPTHGVGGPRVGECRQALVVGKRGKRLVVDAGLGTPLAVWGGGSARRGSIVLVEVVSVNPPRLRLGCPRPIYNGYSVEVVGGLRAAVDRGGEGRLVVATSRYGEVFSHSDAVRLFRGVREVVVLFGSPWRGLTELAKAEGLELARVVDRIWNTVPCQGTRTVRVEEAVAATLALLNLYLG